LAETAVLQVLSDILQAVVMTSDTIVVIGALVWRKRQSGNVLIWFIIDALIARLPVLDHHEYIVDENRGIKIPEPQIQFWHSAGITSAGDVIFCDA